MTCRNASPMPPRRSGLRVLLMALGAVLLLGVFAVAASPVLAAPPPTNHPIEGHSACTSCHNEAAGTSGPSHSIYPDSSCLTCHPVGQSAPALPSPTSTTPPPAQTIQPLPTPAPKPKAEPMRVGADTCLLCHESPGLSTKLPSGEVLDVHVDGEKMAKSVHGGKLECVDCHTTMTTFPHQKTDAKTVREFQVVQYESCERCHGDIYQTYLESVHGRALRLENNADVPLCGDCHGTHDVRDTDSPSYRLDSPKMCATCHSDPTTMARYDLSPTVYKTYSQDFHGATVMVEGKAFMPHQVGQAVCYDCHGVHDVKSLTKGDPAKVHQAVLTACQKCHPNAGDSFPQAWLGHYELSLEKAPAAWIARAWYIAFIPFMVGGMAIHIGADLYQSRRRKK